MELQPVARTSDAAYPERKASLVRIAGRWVRRVGAVACAATAFWTVGCWGITEGGAAPGPEYFYCYPDQSEMGQLSMSGSFDGQLCSGDSVSGSLTVMEPATLRFSIASSNWIDGGNDATVDIVSPEGSVVGSASPGLPAEVSVSAGEWQVIVVPANLADRSFTLTIEELGIAGS